MPHISDLRGIWVGERGEARGRGEEKEETENKK
jgi:hypothetical protein